MRRLRLPRRLTTEQELARIGLVLGPETAEQLRRHDRAAQEAAFRTFWLRWLVIGLFAAALVGWVWDMCNQGGVR